jgi:integrase
VEEAPELAVVGADAGDFCDMRRVPDAPNLIEMRHYLAGRGAESAEFAEFMAFSGARKGEAAAFVWEDDLPDCVILRGMKTETSRNRDVPKIGALREALERLRARRRAGVQPAAPRSRI